MLKTGAAAKAPFLPLIPADDALPPGPLACGQASDCDSEVYSEYSSWRRWRLQREKVSGNPIRTHASHIHVLGAQFLVVRMSRLLRTCLHRGCEEDVKREQGGCDHDGTEIGTGGMRGTYPAIVGRKGRNDRPPSFPASLSSSTSTGWSFSSKGNSRVGGVGARRPSLDTIQWSARNMMRISVSYTLNRKP